MRTLDVVVLAGVLLLAGWRWCAPAWRSRGRRAASALLALLAMVTVSLRVLPAVPTLPAPDGPYPLGTTVFRWTDGARDEPHTADTTDRRSVIAQLWYPAVRYGDARDHARLPYLEGTAQLPEQVSGLPRFLLRRHDAIDSHATASAPLRRRERPWPVVILSPGYGAPRAWYTGLATRLASRGFVVVTVDHPFESGVTQLPNGAVVGTQELFPPGPRDRVAYMVRQQRVRTDDIRFVIDQLSREVSRAPSTRAGAMDTGAIDTKHVAVIGHSFGGAAAAMVMSEDPRVVAAANIDGTPYGDLPTRQLTRPFLLLQSDLAESPHGSFFHNGNGALLARMTAPGYRYEIARANHFSFTDAPLFLAAPGRWLLAQFIGGARGPADTQRVTADLLAAFLAGPLTGVPADLAAVAAAHDGVVGGAVRR